MCSVKTRHSTEFSVLFNKNLSINRCRSNHAIVVVLQDFKEFLKVHKLAPSTASRTIRIR